MKCIKCSTDNDLRERTASNGRCKNCSHPFVFEPTAMGTVKITDPMFAKAIEVVSANNSLFFTAKQLFYHLEKRTNKEIIGTLGGFSVAYLFVYAFVVYLYFMAANQSINPYPIIITFSFAHALMVILLYQRSRSRKNNYLVRRWNARRIQVSGVLVLLCGLPSSIYLLNSFPIFLTALLTGVTSIYLGTRQVGKLKKWDAVELYPLISSATLKEWITKWQKINPIDKLLTSANAVFANTPTQIESEVSVYSFDRLVVCDTSSMAQLLIANNFHFEYNCAILSIDGYPQAIFETTMQMLHRNPDLKVFALHDCNALGMSITTKLSNSDKWFAGSNILVVDVGLLPRHIMNEKKTFNVLSSKVAAKAAQQLSSEIRQRFSDEELAWLDAGNYVELESFATQTIIRILNRSITKGASDSGAIAEDTFNSSNRDESIFIYSAESFG